MNHILFQKILNKSLPILITGETGTGKTYLAKKIFEESIIHKQTFLTLNLATIKEDLLESELFGHVKGAFTGATESKAGFLQSVGSGTLFLDEIGELSLNGQKKLLRLIDERIYHPVGSTKELHFSGRIIMATNKSLEEMVTKGQFREDLLYRINIVHFHLEPLQINSSLGKNLIQTLFEKLARKHYKSNLAISDDVITFLQQKNWRGNIRELKNTMELAIVLCETKSISVDNFIFQTQPSQNNSPRTQSFVFDRTDYTYQSNLEKFEKEYLTFCLMKNSGKVCLTANELAISKTTLIQKARKYGINTLQMRASADLKIA